MLRLALADADAIVLRVEVVPGVVAEAPVGVVNGPLHTTHAPVMRDLIRRRRFSKQLKQLSSPAQLKRFEVARTPADGVETKESVY